MGNSIWKTLREFLGRVRRAKLTVRPSKCEMGFENMEFVGHEVKKGEIGLHADNIKKIREAPRPKTKTQVSHSWDSQGSTGGTLTNTRKSQNH